jgi:ribosomal protein S18 acetylase RimI-like enzyme
MVLGYALYRLHDRSFHLERLAVSPHCRRQGIATCLLLFLTTRAQSLGRRRCVTTCCEERNLPVQCLLRALGFRCISSRPDPDLPEERVYFFRYLALSPEIL